MMIIKPDRFKQAKVSYLHAPLKVHLILHLSVRFCDNLFDRDKKILLFII